MNFSLKHIKNHFVIHILFFVLFCLLTLSIGRYLSAQIIKYNKTLDFLEYLNTNILESDNVCSNFRVNVQSEDQFVSSGKNKYTDHYNNLIANIIDTLNHFKNNNSVIKDSFLIAISSYKTTFNYLVLGFKELGIKNSGNLNSVQSISNNMMELAKYNGNIDICFSLADLKKYENNLFFNNDLRAYNEIDHLINTIRNNTVEKTYESLSSAGFYDLLTTYSSKINLLYTQIKHIDQNGNTGLVSELHKDYSKVLTSLDNFKYSVLDQSNSILRIRILICIILFLILSCLYILILWNLQKIVGIPLVQTLDFSYNLSKGKLPPKDLSLNFKAEFGLMSSNLNSLNNSLKEKRKFIESLLKQKFNADLSLQGKNDTFGKTLLALKENMRKAREEQIQHAEENKLRRFLNEGIAKFADILRSNSDELEKLSDVFIRELVKYMDAIQGGLFLIKEDNESNLYLAAAFAYNRKKYIVKTIVKGEGLVGTCALEMKTINLTEIPEDYLEITSGLGESPPRNLLLMPVMHESILIGVIEIASAKKMEPHQIEAGERIADSLASTIIAARVNTKTTELLKKSQEQAAEMSEQEEEMRQNMEELKATQEESARREEELKGVINALHKSFYVLEYDTEGLIYNANERLLFLLNITLEKILGKTHMEVFGQGSKADSILFSKVADGNIVELVENVTINNKQLVLRNTFSPIQSKEGKTNKVLNVISVNF